MKLILKKSDIQKVFFVIFFVLIYFTPEFRFLPYYTWILALLGIAIVFNTRTVRKVGLMSRDEKIFGLLLITSVFYLGIALPIFHGTFDFTYFPVLIGIVLCMYRNYLVSYLLLKNKYIKRKPVEQYIDILVSACCICVSFTILFIVFPNFKRFWLESVIVNNVSQAIANAAAYEFRYSISGFAAFSYSTLFSIATVLQAYIICRNKMNLRNFIRFGVLCVGCFFYGRVTIVAIIIAVVMIVTKEKGVITAIKFLFAIIITIIGILIVLRYLETIDMRFSVWGNWAFSFIEDIFVNREITTYSVNYVLDNMYFAPELKTILIGDGYYTDPITGRYYMGTDVGYMRMLLYGGVGGTLIAYAPMIYVMWKIYKKSIDKELKRLVIFVVSIWIVLEAKGESYFRIILFLYPILLLSNMEEKNELAN